MPVTIRLSSLFTERLGEEIATELVDWFNAVDATYRADLRELNELNFSRFDAKLDQRLAELKADLRTEFAERLGKLREELSDRLRDTKLSLIRWMFAFWIGTALVVIGSRLAR
jgi:hypothetical protein